MGEAQNQPFQLSFYPRLGIEFQGSRATSDGGLLLMRGQFVYDTDPRVRAVWSQPIRVPDRTAAPCDTTDEQYGRMVTLELPGDACPHRSILEGARASSLIRSPRTSGRCSTTPSYD
jgi:hypothetical protein